MDRAARVDAELKVGQVTQEIDVTGTPPTLVTDRAEVSTGLSRGDVTQLPTLNRNLTSLQLLMPGAQLHTGPHASSENPQGGMQINANGLRFGAQNFLLDGTDNNDPVLGIIMINPTIESVSDYKYTSSNYDAEFAQVGGAVIQVETKSGTNQLHGALFEFLQNDIFKARNSFSEPKGPLPLRWNQFGGAAGRPDHQEQAVLLRRLSGHSPTHRRVGPDHFTYPGDARWRLLGVQPADLRPADR